MSDRQCRGWQLTINNPDVHGYTHDVIIKKAHTLKPLVYMCMADEIGESGTYHTHVYMHFRSGMRFTTLKKIYPGFHLEPAVASARVNRAYIFKESNFCESEKHCTRLPDTWYEEGTIPKEKQQGKRSDLEAIYSMVADGRSNLEIFEQFPKAGLLYLDKIERLRQELLFAKYENEMRDVEVFYIWGPAGSGKTSGVLKKYGMKNVYRVCDYEHPFDKYAGQPVLMLDEYRSQLKISELLDLTDSYPLVLRSRYYQKVACYNTAIIVSNWKLEDQYRHIQEEDPETWRAFRRRIHHVIEYRKGEEPCEQIEGFTRVNDEDIPF